MTRLIRRIAKAMRDLNAARAELAAATEANSEAVRRIHRAQERIGRCRSLDYSPARREIDGDARDDVRGAQGAAE